MPKSPVEDIVRRVIEETKYREFLRESDEKESKDRIANVEELVNAAHEYGENYYEGSLQGFLEEVALVSDVDELEDDVDAVTLMTLHTAKGLSFPLSLLRAWKRACCHIRNPVTRMKRLKRSEDFAMWVLRGQ